MNIKLPELNLPPITSQIEFDEDKYYIIDIVRKKRLVLTPEEWVRQHIINWLLLSNYPLNLIQVESGLRYNTRKKRADIVVYDRSGNPFFLIECKASTINLDSKVCQQLAVYNTKLNCPFVMISNGLQHFVWNTLTMEQMNKLPIYNEI